MEGDDLPYFVQPMQLEDVPEVTAIERQSFTTPWPVYAYRRELKDNRTSRYIVVRWLEPEDGRAETGPTGQAAATTDKALVTAPEPESQTAGPSAVRRAISWFLPFWRQDHLASPKVEAPKGTILGYAGLWLVLDEAHVTTVAVRPDLRGQGLGELLLVRLIEIAQEMGAHRMTLEVRVSNEVAQNLYRKYTFKVEGVRRRYYSDDNEDALIMWSEPLASPEFQARFAELRAGLYTRLGERLARS